MQLVYFPEYRFPLKPTSNFFLNYLLCDPGLALLDVQHQEKIISFLCALHIPVSYKEATIVLGPTLIRTLTPKVVDSFQIRLYM